MTNPTPAEIRAARKKAGLTQQKAAEMIGFEVRSWNRWESGNGNMHPALFDFFCRKCQLSPNRKI
jgi:transcriptional regulator with XRE-family HTH domain